MGIASTRLSFLRSGIVNPINPETIFGDDLLLWQELNRTDTVTLNIDDEITNIASISPATLDTTDGLSQPPPYANENRAIFGVSPTRSMTVDVPLNNNYTILYRMKPITVGGLRFYLTKRQGTGGSRRFVFRTASGAIIRFDINDTVFSTNFSASVNVPIYMIASVDNINNEATVWVLQGENEFQMTDTIAAAGSVASPLTINRRSAQDSLQGDHEMDTFVIANKFIEGGDFENLKTYILNRPLPPQWL